MSTEHSARAQGLGYLYQQVRYSLYLILKKNAPNLAIRIEGLDDIDIWEEGQLRELLQGKLHLNQNGSLSDRSIDLWKTIGIWSEYVKETKISPFETTLTLFTTVKAPKDSIASLLHPNYRNPQFACKRLREETKKRVKSLNEPFDAFMNLSPQQQEQLVESIQIFDSSPNILDITKEIETLFLAVAEEYRGEVRKKLEIWWLDIVIDHLYNNSEELISKRDVENKLALINEDYKLQLPDEYWNKSPEDISDPKWRDYRFVCQLIAIDVKQEPIEMAIRDYWKAFTQRDKWQNNFRISDDKLAKYEQNLSDNWKYCRFDLEMSFEDNHDYSVDDANESDLKRFGRQLYQKTREREIHITPEFTSSYMMLGSYHILADELDKENTPRIWWHPKFPERD